MKSHQVFTTEMISRIKITLHSWVFIFLFSLRLQVLQLDLKLTIQSQFSSNFPPIQKAISQNEIRIYEQVTSILVEKSMSCVLRFVFDG